MATCKDCVHYEACKSQVPRTFWDSESFYDDCEHFKDKSRYIELPCAVGDTVYINESIQGWYFRRKNRPYKGRINFIGITGESGYMNVVFENDYMFFFDLSQIGKTIFFAREEAEKALKEERKK